jgi:hypothetical protein
MNPRNLQPIRIVPVTPSLRDIAAEAIAEDAAEIEMIATRNMLRCPSHMRAALQAIVERAARIGRNTKGL